MASTLSSAKSVAPIPADSATSRRVAEILEHATNMFYEKGYAGASMRDLSAATGMSLAGLYYHFKSKEEVLYAIQKVNFEAVLERLRERLAGVSDPERRIRIFIRNHVGYFLANLKGMKVLTHENEFLSNDLGKKIQRLQRQYYKICYELVDGLKRQRGQNSVPTRVAVLSLFGMINWIYTWYNPQTDVNAAELAQHMGDLFLARFIGSPDARPRRSRSTGA